MKKGPGCYSGPLLFVCYLTLALSEKHHLSKDIKIAGFKPEQIDTSGNPRMGIIHTIRNNKDLDEAPGSYKDIAVVMDNQRDLVDIVVELSPLAVIKG